ncbi:MAG: hypothetical protein KA524_06600 [Nitrosomonas sp.]|nr:hypothetical protein [Nitrosomonas sp.]MBP6077041.1 hypothetical protein [Nitrosomonas sp.]
MPVTTFNIDEKMGKTLEELQAHFGASSKAEVLRKAVALLKIAKESEAADGSITIRKDDEDQKIIIK